MLTKLTIRNFKRFDEAVIELAEPVVFIGPNNSGKTTALQALALWDVGLRAWLDKRGAREGSPEKRPGVSINRKDLVSLPIPSALMLWNDLHVRATTQTNGERGTENVQIEIQKESIQEISSALEKLGRPSPWSPDIKATDDFLDPLFKDYSRRLGVPLTLRKNEYHKLAAFLEPQNIAIEVRNKLDAILAVAIKASPVHR